MPNTPSTITHATLSHLVEAGAVRAVQVLGQPGGWAVVVRYGMHERALAAQRSGRVRLFRRFETLAAYLRDLGLARWEVDASGYAPDGLDRPRRPDAAAAMRRAHAAARRLGQGAGK